MYTGCSIDNEGSKNDGTKVNIIGWGQGYKVAVIGTHKGV